MIGLYIAYLKITSGYYALFWTVVDNYRFPLNVKMYFLCTSWKFVRAYCLSGRSVIRSCENCIYSQYASSYQCQEFAHDPRTY
jgi:hypothetical protein